MCFLTVSSRPCLETSPHSILRTPFAGHCLGALWGGKPRPAELSEGVSRVFRTLSGDTPLPILQTPSAGHCLDTHGKPVCRRHTSHVRSQQPLDSPKLQSFFPGISFGIALHSLYRKYFSAEIIWLYITLSWPQPLSCTSFCLHYVQHLRREWILGCITSRLH